MVTFTNVLQFCGEVQGHLRLTSYHTFQKTAPLTLWLAVHAPWPLFCYVPLEGDSETSFCPRGIPDIHQKVEWGNYGGSGVLQSTRSSLGSVMCGVLNIATVTCKTCCSQVCERLS